MTAINGHGAPDPARDVAQFVYAAGFEDGDTPWAELSEDERDALIGFAHDHLQAHLRWLVASGFKVIPPGHVPNPTSDDEAMAMVKVAKHYFDAKKRKGHLVASGPRPKLIVPGKLN
jgi:hypothetical protein